MRILFVTSSSINGGAQKHIREMYKSLTSLGHEMYIAAPKGWLLDELREYRERCYSFSSIRNGIKTVSRLIETVQPDVINTFILSGAVIGTMAWKKKKIGKLFITVNNPVVYDGITVIRKILYPLLYRYLAQNAVAFLVKSDKVRDEVELVIKSKKPVISIKNGVDFTVFNKNREYSKIRSVLDIRDDEIIIGNVAVLNERKGQQYLIEAVNNLREIYPVHLIIAGEGPFRLELEQQIVKLNASKFIHLLGRRSDINTVLANCDLFVLPSLHEGLPNSLMEAMAMGLACIATDVGGVRQLITDNENGLVVRPKSSKEIVSAVKKLLTDTKIMNIFGEKAYEFMQRNFKQEVVAKDLIDIYQTIN